MKKCSRCTAEFDESFFYRRTSSPNGLNGICKSCSREIAVTYYLKNKERVIQKAKDWAKNNKEKKKLHARKYAESVGSGKNNEYYKEWRKKNVKKCSDQTMKWSKANPVKRKEIIKKWHTNNPHIRAMMSSENRMITKRAIAVWANKFFIKEIYHLAKIRTLVTGIRWHVDHIVPLRGKLVCGLHVENNLRVITAKENMEKGCKFVV